MVSAGAIKAGEAFVEVTLASRIQQGAAAVEKDVQGVGNRLIATGLKVSGSLAAALTFPVKLASDAQETGSKFNVVFGGMAESMKKFVSEQSRVLGLSRTELKGMLASVQDLLVPMGGAADVSAEMSKQISGLAVDLGSFNNMRTSDVMRDIQAALTGSGETMKKYGVIVNEAAVKQELLNMQLDPNNVTEFQKAQARLTIILRGTTAAQGDAVRTGDEFANSIRRLRAQIRDLNDKYFQPLLDDLSEYVKLVRNAIGATDDWIQRNGVLADGLGGVTAAVGGTGGGLIALGAGTKVAAGGLKLLVSGLTSLVGTVSLAGLAIRGSAIGLRALARNSISAWSAVKALMLAGNGLFASLRIVGGSGIRLLTGLAGPVILVTSLFVNWGEAISDVVKGIGDIGKSFNRVASVISEVLGGERSPADGLLTVLKIGFAQTLKTIYGFFESLGNQIVGVFVNAGKLVMGVIGGLTTSFQFNFGLIGKAVIEPRRFIAELMAELKNLGSVLAIVFSPGEYLRGFDLDQQIKDLQKSLKNPASDPSSPDDQGNTADAEKQLSIEKSIRDEYERQKAEYEKLTFIRQHGMDAYRRSQLESIGLAKEEIDLHLKRVKEIEGASTRARVFKNLMAEALLDQKEFAKYQQRQSLTDQGFSKGQIARIEGAQELGRQRREARSQADERGQSRFSRAVESESRRVRFGGDIEASAMALREFANHLISTGQVSEEVGKAFADSIEGFRESQRKAQQLLADRLQLRQVRDQFERLGQTAAEYVRTTGNVQKAASALTSFAETLFLTGKITRETFEEMKRNAGRFAEDQEAFLAGERKSLKQELETPEETIRREFKETIERIRASFGPDSDQGNELAGRARGRRDKQLDDLRKKDEKQAREIDRVTGPTGSFSAVGAAIIGLGARQSNPVVDELKISNKRLKAIEKNAKKGNIARFA